MLARVLGVIVRKRLQDFGLVHARNAIPAPAASGPGVEPLPTEHLEHRRLEREWQNSVGHALLDKPHAEAGSAAVFGHQFDRIAELLRDAPPGVLVEVGCGKGHLLRRLRDKPWLAGRALVGLDLSRAVFALPPDGLAGVEGDGETLPFRQGSLAALVYDGALHHLIDYPQALREAMRVLAPGGMLVIFEPVSSAFSRLVHRVLDPIIFRKTVYESPIDQLYKARFREDVIVRVLREGLRVVAYDRSDFLAYPFTGCYAGLVFGRSEPFMRRLLALEDVAWKAPVMRRVARALAWRFLIVAVKPSS